MFKMVPTWLFIFSAIEYPSLNLMLVELKQQKQIYKKECTSQRHRVSKVLFYHSLRNVNYIDTMEKSEGKRTLK